MRRFLRQTVSALEAPASFRLTPAGRWASAPILVLLAFLVQYSVLPKPAIAPFVFFYFSVALASWLGGRLPGLFTVGLSALRAFRADVTLRGAALVALTGYALAEDRDKALAAGFDSHLAKPPDLAALERLLAELPTRRAA